MPPVSALSGLPLDGATWAALLATAGPQDAAWLIRQITTDLARMRDDLTLALRREDTDDIRRASHALAGLGGTIGAVGLQQAALALLEAARSGDDSVLPTQGAEVLDRLAAVLGQIAQQMQGTVAP